ncbi:MAG: chalcone isomerase family protein [Betaproteobacteria bacterium]
MRHHSPGLARLAPLFLVALVLMARAAGAANASAAPPLPSQVVEQAPNLKVQGGGELTFFGISIYDGYYWSQGRGWTKDGTFALDLHYHRALTGAKIAERSVHEIEKLGYGTVEQRSRWGEAMKSLFPNVLKGDRITGVNLPGGIVRYFFNGKPLGEIAEPGFALAFFGIWLDPKSSRPDFRQQLLGEKP